MHSVAVNALELLHRPPRPLWDRTCWYVPPAAAQHITVEVLQLEIKNYSSNGGMMRELSFCHYARPKLRLLQWAISLSNHHVPPVLAGPGLQERISAVVTGHLNSF